MKIKEEPRSPSRPIRDKNVRDRVDRNHSKNVKRETSSPHRKRKHSDREHHSPKHKRENDRHHRSHSRRKRERVSPSPSPRDHSRDRSVKRERSISDGEIPDRTNSRWGSLSDSHGTSNGTHEKKSDKPKEKPNLGLSGALAKETNMYRGVLINYSEPPEAKVPKKRWRFYPFKGTEEFKPLYLHRQSAYLIGRDKNICDMPLLHPSISKQHAVLQYRSVPYTKADGSQSRAIRPYLIDLNSPNGTFLNGTKVEPQRYIELKEKDVLKFAFSSRDYVLLHEKSKEDEEDE